MTILGKNFLDLLNDMVNPDAAGDNSTAVSSRLYTINYLKYSGNYMYHLHFVTQCILLFCMTVKPPIVP